MSDDTKEIQNALIEITKKFAKADSKELKKGSPIFASLFQKVKPHQMFELLDNYLPAYQVIGRHGGMYSLRKMYENDDEIAAATDTRMEACTATPWTLEGEDEELNDFIYDCIKDHVEPLINYLWWAVPYGYAVTQIVYDEEEYKRSRIFKPKCILDQPFDEFIPTRHGYLARRETIIEQDLQPVEPEAKYIYVVRKPSYHHPYGESLYLRLYYPFIYRCHGWEFFMSFLETWGKPFLHGKTKKDMIPGQNQSTVEMLNDILGALKRPSAVVTDQETEINVLQTTNNGTSFDIFNKAVSERIQRAILGQNLTSSSGNVGSQALGTVHNEVRHDKRRADCKLVSQGVQQLIDKIVQLNKIEAPAPKFKMEDPQGLEQDRAERDVKLIGSGNIRFTEKYFMEQYGFNEEDFNIVEQSSSLTNLDFQAANEDILKMIDGDHIHKFVDPEGLNPRQRASFDLETQAINAAGDLLDFEEMQALIRSSKSKKDLENKLEAVIDRNDTKFTDILTRALYIAQLKGYIDGKESVEA